MVLTWFWLNLKIGALSFGGAGRALLFEEEVVGRLGWLTAAEFREIFTLAQGLPGPNLLNICVYLGLRLVGWRGVLLGLAGISLPGAFLVVAAYRLVDFENVRLATFFRGLTLGSVPLIGMLCTKVARGLRSEGKASLLRDPRLLTRLAVAAAVAVATSRGVPIAWVLALGGGVGVALEFVR